MKNPETLFRGFCVSAYKNRAVEQQTRDVQAPTRNVRNDSAGTTLSTNNIPQQSSTVKESGAPILQRVEAVWLEHRIRRG